MSVENQTIWVLGSYSSIADNCIAWSDPIPNLSNCDVLIIDQMTIRPEDFPTINHIEIRRYLIYRLIAKKPLFVIFNPSLRHHDMLPMITYIVNIENCLFKTILTYGSYNHNELFEYINYVEYADYYIRNYSADPVRMLILAETGNIADAQLYHRKIASTNVSPHNRILNVVNQTIGNSFHINVVDVNGKSLAEYGIIHILPPPTKITSTEAVGVIINSLLGSGLREEAPEWVTSVNLPKVDDINQTISDQQQRMKKIEEEINTLERQKQDIEIHLRLLWTDGEPLEKAVEDAFRVLGFSEILPGRRRNLEDRLIEMTSSQEYELGIMEIKGAEKRTSLANINQCLKWVLDYRVNEGKEVKGIFIPNQHRRTESLESEERLHFEPNEIKFAKDFSICILPTSELFKCVRHVLEGNSLSREVIESMILGADPIFSYDTI